jgi:predicted phage terminase large subunit-like protein
MYSADEPDRLRGPQHHFAWCDELATWRYPETWDMLMFGLRLGAKPQVLITTTPKPVKLLRDILNKEDIKSGVVRLISGSTFENQANLAPNFVENIWKMYGNSPLGRQELFAVLLEDLEGALWKRAWFKYAKRRELAEMQFTRIVAAIDPAVTSKSSSDQTGICVAAKGIDDNYYVLHLQGYTLTPQGWAEEAVRLYKEKGADKIVAEINNGGDMVEATIRHVTKYANEYGKVVPINGQDLPIKTIHASRGKRTRAEPIAALYEQGRVIHAQMFKDAEDQLALFTGDPSEKDDMVDALVWALTELSEGEFREYVKPRVGGFRKKQPTLTYI